MHMTCRVGLIVASVAKNSFFYSQSTYLTMLLETVVNSYDGCQSVWFLPIKMLYKLLVVPDSGEDKNSERLEYLESELACEIIV
jgi:hypothetical protein